MPPLSRESIRSAIVAAFAREGVAPGTMVRSASLAGLHRPGQRAVPNEDGSLLWTLATEQPAVVWDWDRWDFVEEVLLMDGLMLPDIRQVPLLDSHNRSSVDDLLGSVTDFTRSVVGGFAATDGLVRFAADEKSQRTKQKVIDGHLTDGSIGYQVLRSVWIPEGTEAAIKGRTFSGPLKVSYEWMKKEFSTTPIGADTLAKVRSLCAGGRGGRSVLRQ